MPLLAPNVIKKITNRLLEKHFHINAKIITNGYYLTTENLELLQHCGIKSIQLTIDGLAESHNRKKFTNTDNNTFNTIIENIDGFYKMNLDMQMIVRVNIDRNNSSEYNDIFYFFTQRYPDEKKVSISPALIVEHSKNAHRSSCMLDQVDRLALLSRHAEATNNKLAMYPSNAITECAVRNLNCWIFDAKGNAYKCWEIIGNKDYKVGELTEKGLVITNTKIYNRYLVGEDPFESSKCKECISLPICIGGGCPHKRIENKFYKKQFNYCTYFHDKLEEYMMFQYEKKDFEDKKIIPQ